MGKFVKGDIVIIPFPFSDLSNSKNRPAMVITSLAGDDIILCSITSRSGINSIPLHSKDFAHGTLHHDSNIRPDHLFTANSNIILKQAGQLSQTKINETIDKIVSIIRK